MSLAVLIAGIAVFLGAHLFVTRRAARAALISRLGEGLYKGLFALVSLIGLALIVWGYSLYRETVWIEVWSPPRFMRHVTVGLMWFSVVFVLAAYLPGHIQSRLKHPMLAGVKIWAFAHLLSNGDLGSIVLFGSFLAWAVYARIAVKKREAMEGVPPAGRVTWARVTSGRVTSGHVTSGRVTWGHDALAIGVGTLLYLALGYAFHPVVIGVPVFGS